MDTLDRQIKTQDRVISRLAQDHGFVWSSMGIDNIRCVLGTLGNNLEGVNLSVESFGIKEYSWEVWINGEMIDSSWQRKVFPNYLYNAACLAQGVYLKFKSSVGGNSQ